LTRQRNTVVVVEHDPDVIGAADHVIDMGPGSGPDGGRIVAEGSPAAIRSNSDSLTGRYMSARSSEPPLLAGRTRPGIRIMGARANNLRSIDVEVPAGALTAITGISGSGKSSLVFDVLLASAKAARSVNCNSIHGLERFERVLHVCREPSADNPRSVPATYLGIFEIIRGLFAATEKAKSSGIGKSHFSFLTKEGRCETCGGAGKTRISMDFLVDVWTTCEGCGGARYNPEILKIEFRGKTIAEVLALSASEAKAFFSGHRQLERSLVVLVETGLGYIQLGQPLDTLSGGEAQRLKLAARLMEPASGNCLYLLDEPTTGLHFSDIENLLKIFSRLLDQGHTLVVIEHNLAVIARAHYIIDLGPEGGDEGGRVVAHGTPAEIAACPASYTGAALKSWDQT